MTARYAVVRAARPPTRGSAAPPAVSVEQFALALLEDVVEVLTDLAGVTGVLAVSDDDQAWRQAAQSLTWPGTPVVTIDLTGAPGDGAHGDLATLAALADLGAEEALVVAADVPDVPTLLLAKLYSGLDTAEVAVCPATGGGLVALACRLPVPDWLQRADAGLDTPDALERLRAAAPRRAALVIGPGWHRLRAPTDIAHLDPGLEGWAVTRALLSRPGQ